MTSTKTGSDALPLTIPDLIRLRAAEDGQTAALVGEDSAITYAEFDERSARLAASLLARGVTPRSRVALLMPNGIDWAVASVAIMRLGAVLVPLSTLLRPPELELQLRTAAVEALITIDGFRGRDYLAELTAMLPSLDVQAGSLLVDPVLPALRHVWRWEELRIVEQGSALDEIARALEAQVHPSDDMVIMFTSGSRGAPKGVIHTHASALRATRAGLPARRIVRGERLYIPMPFFWVGGFGGGLLSVFLVGATLLTEAQPEPEQTLRLLARERATLFRGWPDQAARLAAHPDFATTDLSSLRAGSLEAVLPAELRAAPGARPNLFGMTESFGPYCGDRLDVDLPPAKWGSCGRPFAGIEVRIVDPDLGVAVPDGAPGEIQLRGPNMMRGICGRAREEVFTADGFYPTGDLGYLDPDGYLFFAGRLDDMFKVKGASVYPVEVEAALQSIPFVRRAFVADVLADDGTSEVGAAVALRHESVATIDDLAREARDRLSAFKIPTRWVILTSVDEVPMLATGKIDKTGLVGILQARGQRYRLLGSPR